MMKKRSDSASADSLKKRMKNKKYAEKIQHLPVGGCCFFVRTQAETAFSVINKSDKRGRKPPFPEGKKIPSSAEFCTPLGDCAGCQKKSSKSLLKLCQNIRFLQDRLKRKKYRFFA